MAAAAGGVQGPDYKEVVEKLKGFLQEFEGDDVGEHKYMKLLQEVANRQRKLVEVELDDVTEALGDDYGLLFAGLS